MNFPAADAIMKQNWSIRGEGTGFDFHGAAVFPDHRAGGELFGGLAQAVRVAAVAQREHEEAGGRGGRGAVRAQAAAAADGGGAQVCGGRAADIGGARRDDARHRGAVRASARPFDAGRLHLSGAALPARAAAELPGRASADRGIRHQAAGAGHRAAPGRRGPLLQLPAAGPRAGAHPAHRAGQAGAGGAARAAGAALSAAPRRSWRSACRAAAGSRSWRRCPSSCCTTATATRSS